MISPVLQGQQKGGAENNKTEAAIPTEDSVVLTRQERDSIEIESLTFQLQEMKMNEIVLMNEIDKSSKSIKEDSIKKANQRRQIDSLRMVTEGMPIIIEGDTLFKLYTKRGGINPRYRAEGTQTLILKYGKSLDLKRDSLHIYEGDFTSDIMYGEKVILSLTDQDGLWQNKSRQELAGEYLPIILKAMDELQAEYGLEIKVKRFASIILIIIIQLIFIVLTHKLFRRLRRKIAVFSVNRLKPLKFKDSEILSTHQQGRVLLFISQIIKFIIIILQLFISISMLFSIFPETENLALTLFLYVWNPIKAFFVSAVAYTPKLFKILVIYLCFKYIVRGFKYLATQIATEKLNFSGFYSDWAYPSYYIIRFLLYCFMFIMIWPLLPNSDSPIFSGVSVFVGLIISLGSTTVIGNLLAGMVITYMRPFRQGDQIKINETTGCVIEKTAFVTRIRTLKNEVVTIPNSFIMSSQTINYSSSAHDFGLVLHVEIGVGYDVDMEKVHKLLLEAAGETQNVLKEPKPYVLNIDFADFYCCYQINVFTKEDKAIPKTYSELRQRIRDKFNAAGIEMVSPHYYTQHDVSKPVMPSKFTDTFSGKKDK